MTFVRMPGYVAAGSGAILERVRWFPADRPKLTPHQREVFDRIARFTRDGDHFVHEQNIGCHGACWRLVRKGYVEAARVSGPRGGEHWYYRVNAPRVVDCKEGAWLGLSRQSAS